MEDTVVGVVRKYFVNSRIKGALDVYIEGRDDVSFQVKASESQMQPGSTIEFTLTEKKFGKKVVCSSWKAVSGKPVSASTATTSNERAAAAEKQNADRQLSIIRQSSSSTAAALLQTYVHFGAIALPEKQAKKLDVLKAAFVEIRDELIAFASLQEETAEPAKRPPAAANEADGSDEDIEL